MEGQPPPPREKIPTLDLIHKYGPDYKVIFVGDAAMAPYEVSHAGGSVEHWNQEAGAVWLGRVLDHWKNAAWLNPSKEQYWDYTASTAMIRKIFAHRMYPMTLAGIEGATRELSRRH